MMGLALCESVLQASEGIEHPTGLQRDRIANLNTPLDRLTCRT
jgi:hypothetical protein